LLPGGGGGAAVQDPRLIMGSVVDILVKRIYFPNYFFIIINITNVRTILYSISIGNMILNGS